MDLRGLSLKELQELSNQIDDLINSKKSVKGKRFAAYYCESRSDKETPWKIEHIKSRAHIMYADTKEFCIELISILETKFNDNE